MPPPPPIPWLHSLKTAQLQNIARATGIRSAGPKPNLTARLEQELSAHRPWIHRIAGDSPRANAPSGNASRDGDGGDFRILSLDMGIKNLAFACLRVPNPNSVGTSTSTSVSTSMLKGAGLLRPELIAWHRLAVEDISSLNLESIHSPTQPSSKLDFASDSGEPPPQSAKLLNPLKEINISKINESSFSPSHYANTAYNVISTLLHNYNPTHILIERQRFRSGNSSAVLEWTLRVGVLEGMLYAVLRTLAAERGGLGGLRVAGVEPKRVVGFWGLGDAKNGGGEGDGKSQKKLNAREVKQRKIDLVGAWLDGALGGDAAAAGADAGGEKIVIPSDRGAVRGMASAYLQKSRGEAPRRRKKDGEAEIGKLDDLADCLLQGVTWLEWQVMRERLVHEGVGALES